MVAQERSPHGAYFGKNAHGGYGGYDVSTQSTPGDSISLIVGSGAHG